MNLGSIKKSLCLITLVAAIALAWQGPLYDKVTVNLPYPVTINDTVLQPGEYVIRQHESQAGGSRVLHIYSDQGLKLETTAMTIPTVDNRTPEQTKVILDHFGNEYYFDKIWIQGKNYGYEFVLPEKVKSRERERMEPSTVAARYEAVPQETTTAKTESTTTTTQTTEQAATPAPAPAPAAAPETPAPAPQETAQATTPAPQETAPAPSAPAAPEAADRSAAASPAMPATAANWLNLLLGGGALSGAGLALRRFRR